MKINLAFDSLQFLPVPMFIYFVVLSVAMIVAGRKILWLYVGSIIFLIAYLVMIELVNDGTLSLAPTAIFLIAFGSGAVVSAILFIFKPVALIIAALVLGINVAVQFIRLLNFVGPEVDVAKDILTMIVGLISVVLSLRYREDAFVLLSVLTGVGLLTQDLLNMNTKIVSTAIVWLALSLFGVIVQYAFLQREQRGRQAKLMSPAVGSSLPTPSLIGQKH